MSASSSPTCSRAAQPGKKCPLKTPTVTSAGPSPTIPTEVAARQVSTPSAAEASRTAACNTHGPDRSRPSHSTTDTAAPTPASAHSSATGVRSDTGTSAPTAHSTAPTA